MKRIAISENNQLTGKWFDAEKAKCFKEDTWWNGSNQISCVTGSQWHHEAIYVTKGGTFVLNRWSNYQGTAETYEIITKEAAAEWFVINNYSDEDLPEVFHSAVAELEIK